MCNTIVCIPIINIEVHVIMVYAMPTNLTSIDLVFDYVNVVTNNMFGIALLISLFAVVMINLMVKGTRPADAMLVGGWMTLIPGIFFYLLGFIHATQFFVVISVLVIAVIWSYASKSPE